MMRKTLRGVCLLLVATAISARADAAIIDFTSFSVGPTADGVLHIGDVTISASDASPLPANGAQPAVVAGIGLGLSPFASSGRIDRSQFATAGQGFGIEGQIDIRVNGTIDALTIQPYFTVTGGPPADPDQVIELNLNLPPFLNFPNYEIINAFAPHTFSLSRAAVDVVRLGLFTDFGPEPWLSNYISRHGRPDGFTWGYAVTSLDYTPAAVPEPASVSLLAVALAWIHRRRASRTS
jgi:hypothetical protein